MRSWSGRCNKRRHWWETNEHSTILTQRDRWWGWRWWNRRDKQGNAHRRGKLVRSELWRRRSLWNTIQIERSILFSKGVDSKVVTSAKTYVLTSGDRVDATIILLGKRVAQDDTLSCMRIELIMARIQNMNKASATKDTRSKRKWSALWVSRRGETPLKNGCRHAIDQITCPENSVAPGSVKYE